MRCMTTQGVRGRAAFVVIASLAVARGWTDIDGLSPNLAADDRRRVGDLCCKKNAVVIKGG